MSSQSATERELREEIAELRIRLEEAKETLRAIQYDEVDALVINTAQGNQVYTLQGQDAELNRFRGEILGQISDAVIVVDQQQYINLYKCSRRRNVFLYLLASDRPPFI